MYIPTTYGMYCTKKREFCGQRSGRWTVGPTDEGGGVGSGSDSQGGSCITFGPREGGGGEGKAEKIIGWYSGE